MFRMSCAIGTALGFWFSTSATLLSILILGAGLSDLPAELPTPAAFTKVGSSLYSLSAISGSSLYCLSVTGGCGRGTVTDGPPSLRFLDGGAGISGITTGSSLDRLSVTGGCGRGTLTDGPS